jgi:dipeptidyl aminopeptidase/acylaminoacyl peptidase
MFRWGSAHELLIGLEIDAWVRTPEGKQALLDLHGG